MTEPTAPAPAPDRDAQARAALYALRVEVAKAVVGQDAAVTGIVVALLCRGHVLLEGVPGVAKTLLVRAVATALSVDTKRIQFTPDLMPGDVTGSLVYDARSAEFSFRAGPVFTNLMLADEINRTPPKTQAALLEAMEERQVSIDGVPRALPDPFMVAATQNPVEYEGTYPLPEAQLDRFLLKLVMPLPPRADEISVLSRHAGGFDPRDLTGAGLRAVATADDLAAGRAAVARVTVAPEVIGYVVDVARATRQSPSLSLGVSPRGATALLAAARAWAWLSGRDYVTPDDVKALARPALRHRVALRPEAELEGATADGVLDGVLSTVAVPADGGHTDTAMAITGRLVLVAALLLPVIALAPGWITAGLLVAVLVILVAVDVALAPSVRRLRLSRRGDTSVRLGERADVMLVVANPTGRRLRARVRDAWPPSAGAQTQRHSVVEPGTQQALTTQLLPTRRGDRPANAVTIRSIGPLGVAGRQASHRVPWEVRVLPAFASRKHLPAKLARLRDLDGRTATLIRGQGTEFDSLREYVPGDDVRSIDWRASARTSEVMVRTWRPERDRRILVVLDTGRTSAGRVGDAPRLDASMDAALLLAALAARAGDHVDLLAYDRRVRASVQGASAAELLPSLVDAMAPLESELLETDARGLVTAVLARAPRRSLIVLLTTLDRAPLHAGLLPELGVLTRRHEVVLCAVADPRIDQMRRERGDANAVYRAASAERDTGERRRTSEELRRRGVEVVDAPPERVAPQLADTYLALKAAGRL